MAPKSIKCDFKARTIKANPDVVFSINKKFVQCLKLLQNESVTGT